MSATITRLPNVAAPASTDCAKLLREALEVAEAGGMRALAIVYVDTDRVAASNFERGDAFASLLGAVALLQHDLIHAGDVPDA